MALIDFADILAEHKLDALIITGEISLAYVTGMNGLEGTAFITREGRKFCFTDPRYIEAATEIVGKCGFDVSTVKGNDYFKHIGSLCSALSIKTIGFEDAYMTVSEYKKACTDIAAEFVPASAVLRELRSCKNRDEIACIIKAQRIAEKAFDILLGEITPGLTENSCKARLEYLMASFGSEQPAFSTVLVSGTKTSMPHGTASDKIIERGDFITFDFGATVNGYRSDMTRTVSVGDPTAEMKKVYDTVLRAQLAAIEAAEVDKELKLVDKAARDIISEAGYGEFFGHATGHGVGLEIHEAPSVSGRSMESVKNGHIITVEPGIYIPGAFGVRIEDMLCFENNNKINLTECPKKLVIL